MSIRGVCRLMLSISVLLNVAVGAESDQGHRSIVNSENKPAFRKVGALYNFFEDKGLVADEQGNTRKLFEGTKTEATHETNSERGFFRSIEDTHPQKIIDFEMEPTIDSSEPSSPASAGEQGYIVQKENDDAQNKIVSGGRVAPVNDGPVKDGKHGFVLSANVESAPSIVSSGRRSPANDGAHELILDDEIVTPNIRSRSPVGSQQSTHMGSSAPERPQNAPHKPKKATWFVPTEGPNDEEGGRRNAIRELRGTVLPRHRGFFVQRQEDHDHEIHRTVLQMEDHVIAGADIDTSKGVFARHFVLEDSDDSSSERSRRARVLTTKGKKLKFHLPR